ncbi:MAG: HAD-IA family hydrolase [Anaerolineae bacterium]|jgi:HAD superfamily hydrolase (TIGR01549 family)|nr:HAD-IA family hydrolase [Anaerolineae bacterium]MBT4312463.1 HAD-IA family hydrolase [Anaerolineae bacterium]MBT4458721.1 HAD-IA family hydrolase [Anaerolineae bacterium]MBT4842269.1 HAD-IA family hydrolase [Anaerolineae bacterium]MBT6062853.1 HAD-IA family hydrolase [Anaerolineae bacterium]
MIVSKNGYKAIFFDLDGTLRHSVPLGADVYREKVIEFGLPISDEKNQEVGCWEHHYWARSEELMRDSKKFDEDGEGFWENYANLRLEKMGASPTQIEEFRPRIFQYFNEEYEPKNWTPPELHQLLPEFRSAGYTLGVLSNRRSSFMDVLEELSLDGYFDGVMFAGEVGSWKPDPKVFTPLLEKFNLAPEETVYVGDNYFADVIGARNAGLVPVLYDPRDIFPEADCVRITSFMELGDIL